MTVFYLLAVDLPSWVLGIDDRSLSCCVQYVSDHMMPNYLAAILQRFFQLLPNS